MTHITKVDVDIPNIDDLYCINCKISPLDQQDPIIKSLFHGQVLTCRLIIYTVKCCIAAPSIQDIGDLIHVIVSKRFYTTGKLQEHLRNLKIKFTNPEAVHPKIYEACLKYTFTFKLAPYWNLIGKSYYLHGSDFLLLPKTIDALDWSVYYNAGNSKIELKPLKLSLCPFDFNVLPLSSPAMVKAFVAQNSINSLNLEFENLWVYVLPRLTKARVMSVSKVLPESCPFNNYNDLRRHWKNMYSYRLPKTDKGMLYFEVIFSKNPHQQFTYPQLCLFSGMPKLLMCENLNEIASEFIQDLCNNVKSVCGKPLKVGQLQSELISLKFSSASETKKEFSKTVGGLRSITNTSSGKRSITFAPMKSQKMTSAQTPMNVRNQKTMFAVGNLQSKSILPPRVTSQKKSKSRFSQKNCEIDDEILLDQNADRRFTDEIENLDDIISYYDLPSMWAETIDEFNNATADAGIIKDCENYKRSLRKDSLRQLISLQPTNAPTIKKIEKVQYDLSHLKKKQDTQLNFKPILKPHLKSANPHEEEYQKMLVDELNVSDYCGQSLLSSFNAISNNDKNLKESKTESSDARGNNLKNYESKDQKESEFSEFDMNGIYNKNEDEKSGSRPEQLSEHFQKSEEKSSKTMFSSNCKFQNLHQSSNSIDNSLKNRESSEEWKKRQLNIILERNGFDLKTFYSSPFVKSIIDECDMPNPFKGNHDDNCERLVSSKVALTQQENQMKSNTALTKNHSSKTSWNKNPSKNSKNELLNEINQFNKLKDDEKPSKFFDKPSSSINLNVPAIKKIKKNPESLTDPKNVPSTEKIGTSEIDSNTCKFEEDYQKMLVDDLNVSDYCGQSLLTRFSTFTNNNDENLKENLMQQSETHGPPNFESKDQVKQHSEFFINNTLNENDVEMNDCDENNSSEIIEKYSLYQNSEKSNENVLSPTPDQLSKHFQNPSFDVRNFYNSPLVKSIIKEQKTLNNDKSASNYLRLISSKVATGQEDKIKSSGGFPMDQVNSQSKISLSNTSKNSQKLKINQSFSSRNNFGDTSFYDATPLSMNTSNNFEDSNDQNLPQARVQKSPSNCEFNELTNKAQTVPESNNFFDISPISMDYSDKFETSLNRKLLQPSKLQICKSNSIDEIKNSQESKKKSRPFKDNTANNSQSQDFNEFEKEYLQVSNLNKGLQENTFAEKDTYNVSLPENLMLHENENLIDVKMREDLYSYSSPDIFESYDKDNSFSLIEKHCKSDNRSNEFNSLKELKNSKLELQKENNEFMSILSESSDESDSNNF